MNLEKRNELIQFLSKLYDQGETQPLVTAERFFDGNSCGDSICNRSSDGFVGIRRTVDAISARSDVDRILMRVCDCPDEDDEEDEWPVVDAMFVYTSAGKENLLLWREELHCDEADEIFVSDWKSRDGNSSLPDQNPGQNVYFFFWD